MSKPFNIAPIPTIYPGRQYRSRLEARWAAFFDKLGWQHEYEPYDLGKWSPDFALTSRSGGTILLEVKPIQEFNVEVAEKITSACFSRGLQDDVLGYLLVGVAPKLDRGVVRLGWYGVPYSEEPKADWGFSPLIWVVDTERPAVVPDVGNVDRSGAEPTISGMLTDSWHPDLHLLHPYVSHSLALWAQASNAVQWKLPA